MGNSRKVVLCAPNQVPVKVLFQPVHFGGQIALAALSLLGHKQQLIAYRFPSLVMIRSVDSVVRKFVC